MGPVVSSTGPFLQPPMVPRGLANSRLESSAFAKSACNHVRPRCSTLVTGTKCWYAMTAPGPANWRVPVLFQSWRQYPSAGTTFRRCRASRYLSAVLGSRCTRSARHSRLSEGLCGPEPARAPKIKDTLPLPIAGWRRRSAALANTFRPRCDSGRKSLRWCARGRRGHAVSWAAG